MERAKKSERPYLLSLLMQMRAILTAIILLIPLVVINFLQLLSLALKPFSKAGFRNINRAFATFYWTGLVLVVRHILRVRIKWQCDKIVEHEDAILIANHQSAVDIIPLLALACHAHRVGDMKFFVKDVFKYIPGIGWGMIFLDFVFLKRRWMSDRRRIKANFERIHRENIPLWLNIFPEGTRFTALKMLDAQKTARHYKLASCDHVLVPFAKAFETSILALSNKVAAVYDVTIGYPAGIPTFWQLMSGDIQTIEMRVNRFPLGQLPSEALAIEQWLQERFWQKELCLRQLQNEGQFPRPQHADYKLEPIPRLLDVSAELCI